MSPERFRQCLDSLWLSSQKLAAIIGEDERLVRRWKSGSAEIPPHIATWLERLAAAHEANPVPRKSKTFEEATDEDKEVGSGSIWERPF